MHLKDFFSAVAELVIDNQMKKKAMAFFLKVIGLTLSLRDKPTRNLMFPATPKVSLFSFFSAFQSGVIVTPLVDLLAKMALVSMAVTLSRSASTSITTESLESSEKKSSKSKSHLGDCILDYMAKIKTDKNSERNQLFKRN